MKHLCLSLLCLFATLSLPGTAAARDVAEEEILKAPQPDVWDGAGYSVAIDGDTMVVTAPFEDSNASGVNGSQTNDTLIDSGAAYVFGRSGSNWVLQAYLKAPNPGTNDHFGVSAAISGDIIVVGAWLEDSAATGVNGATGSEAAADSGAAYVYVRSGATWAYNAYLKASNTGAADGFGYAVGISGNTIVVGALYEDSSGVGPGGVQTNNNAPNSGAAYVFTRSGNSWTQQAYLKPSNTGSEDLFAISVAVDANTIVVGASQEDSGARTINGAQTDTALEAGAAYVFVRNGAAWSQQAYLKTSNADAGDRFGHSVSVRGDLLVAGAISEAGAATLVNGNQASNAMAQAGAAYVFQRTGAAWAQQAYLKSSNPDQQDQFGMSVAAGEHSVLIGVSHEDSSAQLTDGNAADNGRIDSGAAFLFVRNGTTWTKEAYLKASASERGGRFGWSVAMSGDRAIVGSSGDFTNNYTGSGFAALYSGISPGPLALWRQAWFATQENTGNAADSADPDKDGLINLLEFATGSSPTEPSPHPGTPVKNGNQLSFTWFRNIDVLSEDIAIFPQWSNDLANWNEWGMSETEQTPGISGNIITGLFTSDDRVFLRLRVER